MVPPICPVLRMFKLVEKLMLVYKSDISHNFEIYFKF
jgi:hypothetical protein